MTVQEWMKENRVPSGRCLLHALRWFESCVALTDAPEGCHNWRLVQGVMIDPRNRYLHCWLEAGDKVIDLCRHQYIDRAEYYKIWRVSDVRQFTFDELCELLDTSDPPLKFFGRQIQPGDVALPIR